MSWQYLRATIDGGFWRDYRELVRDQVIPYQWKALNDEIAGAPKSHSLENFRIAAGVKKGFHDGLVFQDSDLFKWLEAAGYVLSDGAAAMKIRAWVEEAVDLIAGAQQPDGYLNTYFTVKEPGRRWKNLREAHELYCAGHLIEAGVAVYRSTGNQKILDVVCRLADHIDSQFGIGEGKIRGYGGHEEIELALVKLYRVTGEKRYLSLAKYFIDERGRSPKFFEQEAVAPDYVPIFDIRELVYYQADRPVREQAAAAGHAVRAMYLYTAMADLALETNDQTLAQACDRLWASATGRRMYITGGIGSSARKEAFTFDYDLPNDTAYAETCAAIGLFLFSHRMANLHHDAQYAEVMERALFNGILSGLALDGQNYFYVNPLEVLPEACDKNGTYRHVKYRRQPWYGCACCPPNIARILASLGEYVYHTDGSALYADLFHEGTISCTVDGREVSFRQRTDYPWSESVSFEFTGAVTVDFDFALRIPSWCSQPVIELNGKKLEVTPIMRNGYAYVHRSWQRGDNLELTLPMPAERIYSDLRVRADHGKVAIQRGPIVYCLEQADNGPNLHTVVLPPGSELHSLYRSDLFSGVYVLTARGLAWNDELGGKTLYGSRNPGSAATGRDLLFIPYYAWANRESGEMMVWIRE